MIFRAFRVLQESMLWQGMLLAPRVQQGSMLTLLEQEIANHAPRANTRQKSRLHPPAPVKTALR